MNPILINHSRSTQGATFYANNSPYSNDQIIPNGVSSIVNHGNNVFCNNLITLMDAILIATPEKIDYKSYSREIIAAVHIIGAILTVTKFVEQYLLKNKYNLSSIIKKESLLVYQYDNNKIYIRAKNNSIQLEIARPNDVAFVLVSENAYNSNALDKVNCFCKNAVIIKDIAKLLRLSLAEYSTKIHSSQVSDMRVNANVVYVLLIAELFKSIEGLLLDFKDAKEAALAYIEAGRNMMQIAESYRYEDSKWCTICYSYCDSGVRLYERVFADYQRDKNMCPKELEDYANIYIMAGNILKRLYFALDSSDFKYQVQLNKILTKSSENYECSMLLYEELSARFINLGDDVEGARIIVKIADLYQISAQAHLRKIDENSIDINVDACKVLLCFYMQAENKYIEATKLLSKNSISAPEQLKDIQNKQLDCLINKLLWVAQQYWSKAKYELSLNNLLNLCKLCNGYERAHAKLSQRLYLLISANYIKYELKFKVENERKNILQNIKFAYDLYFSNQLNLFAKRLAKLRVTREEVKVLEIKINIAQLYYDRAIKYTIYLEKGLDIPPLAELFKNAEDEYISITKLLQHSPEDMKLFNTIIGILKNIKDKYHILGDTHKKNSLNLFILSRTTTQIKSKKYSAKTP